MGHLAIPSHTFKIVGSSGGVSKSKRVRWIVDIVDEKLSFRSGSCKNLGSQGVELERLDGTSMLSGSCDEGIGSSIDELLGVPEIEGTIFESTSNDTLGVLFRWRTPGNVVESDSTGQLDISSSLLLNLLLPRVRDNARNGLEFQALFLVI